MPFEVQCEHCEAVLKVADKYHYKVITCPSCNQEVEAATTETVVEARAFVKELQTEDKDSQVSEVGPGIFELDHSD